MESACILALITKILNGYTIKKPEETNVGDTSVLCGVFEMIGAATILTMQYQDKTSGFSPFIACLW